jgi:hypothetical protein
MSSGEKERAANVAKQVENAFGEVPYPGNDRLVEGSSSETIEVENFLRDRRWQELQFADLINNHESLFFMTPEAIRFYLPAYLIVSLLHYEKADRIPGSVMFLLRPPLPHDTDSQSRFEARFGPLSRPQRNAIQAFLKYLHEEHPEDFPTEGDIDEPFVLLRWWADDSHVDA